VLRPGRPAPDFTLPDDRGTPTSLADLLAAGPLVLYFYPADFTATCTAEACFFRDVAGELAAAGVRVVGVSTDPAAVHAAFKAAHALPFTLLADTDGRVTRAYDARGFFGLFTFWRRRVTYLITPDRRIADAILQDFGLSRHREFVRRTVAAIRVAHGESA
jgi:peroxiredoxin Q/BCP